MFIILQLLELEDDLMETQMVLLELTMNGHVSAKKYKFFSYDENIPDSDKEKQQVKALNKLNKRLHLTFT